MVDQSEQMNEWGCLWSDNDAFVCVFFLKYSLARRGRQFTNCVGRGEFLLVFLGFFKDRRD